MNLAWIRHPHFFVKSKADYQLFDGGEPTGLWVKWCGHPTALRPYYLDYPGRVGVETFRTVAEAKAEAERRTIDA